MKTFKKTSSTSLHPSLKASPFAKAPEDRSEDTVKLRRTGLFYALLLLTTMFNTYTMEPESNAADSTFPPEIHYHIINLLAQTKVAKTLTQAADTINALAKTDKELNALVNDPQFCLRIIKSLAKQFDCSDETAAIALRIQEAQNRLGIQKLFEKLMEQKAFDANELDNLYKQYKNYIDLNFTYAGRLSAATPLTLYNPHMDFKRTLLLIAERQFYKNKDDDAAAKITWLLSKNGVDINAADRFGQTVLMTCALRAQPELVTLLCTYPAINIDKKHKSGETALMFLCEFSGIRWFNIENMQILINAGADPELANNAGLTPLQAVTKSGNQQAVNLIQDAIEKKHEKK